MTVSGRPERRPFFVFDFSMCKIVCFSCFKLTSFFNILTELLFNSIGTKMAVPLPTVKNGYLILKQNQKIDYGKKSC